jgi:hypothetical protein
MSKVREFWIKYFPFRICWIRVRGGYVCDSGPSLRKFIGHRVSEVVNWSRRRGYSDVSCLEVNSEESAS